MTMKRSVFKRIEDWDKLRKRKPLILMGARQVGKTWLMDEFAKKYYPHDTVRVNFMKNERLRSRFETVDLDPKTVLEVISIETGRKIEPGRTLLVLDEIQESARAITSLKFFNEDMPELAVMAAGSLLGLALNRKKQCSKGDSAKSSFPVGKVSFLDVSPMTFEEFLLAIGEDAKCDILKRREWKLIDAFHDAFCDLLRKFYFIGGMPEAVLTYATKGDFMSVRMAQTDMLRAYDEDFAKHAEGSMLEKIRLIWNSIPAQLAKENKKFVYTALRQGARAREYEAALSWLDDAGMIRMVHNVSSPLMPLAGYEQFGSFKLYAHDVGLVGAMTNLPPQMLLEGNGMFTHFKGALTEQFVLQEMAAYGLHPSYWSPDDAKAEVEFLAQIGASIYPVEAKAETNLKAKSLMSYIARYKPARALRLSMSRRNTSGVVEDYPLYAIHEMLDDALIWRADLV